MLFAIAWVTTSLVPSAYAQVGSKYNNPCQDQCYEGAVGCVLSEQSTQEVDSIRRCLFATLDATSPCIICMNEINGLVPQPAPTPTPTDALEQPAADCNEYINQKKCTKNGCTFDPEFGICYSGGVNNPAEETESPGPTACLMDSLYQKAASMSDEINWTCFQVLESEAENPCACLSNFDEVYGDSMNCLFDVEAEMTLTDMIWFCKNIAPGSDPVEEPSFWDNWDGTFSHYRQWCETQTESRTQCKACGGKLKNGECQITKQKQVKCKNLDSTVCKIVGCRYNSSKQKCTGAPIFTNE